MRKRARRKAEGEEGAWVIDLEKVEEILGIPRYAVEEAEKVPEVGVATGLAWTATGGDLMIIEALKMPGTGRLTVTGQLGEVMRESVDAAYSYVRSRAGQLAIPDSDFREYDLHIHLPAGAIPKDGPSAGITLTLTIASCLSGRPVRRDGATTGRIRSPRAVREARLSSRGAKRRGICTRPIKCRSLVASLLGMTIMPSISRSNRSPCRPALRQGCR